MNFSISGFYSQKIIIYNLLKLYKNHPYLFKKGIVIESLYDSFPNLKWNGGRLIDNNFFLVDSDYILKVNNINIGVYFSFTNYFISKEDLHDKECNDVLKVLIRSNLNGVIVSSPLLAKYIKNKYPSLKIKLSLTYFYNNVNNIEDEVIKQLDNNLYSKIVLPPDLNGNFNLLNNINKSNNLEILLNETCYENCKFKEQHYKLISYDNHHKTKKSHEFCQKLYKNRVNKHSLIIEDDKYHSLYDIYGINNYKISGRNLQDNLYIYFLSYYLIKKEYTNSLLSNILEFKEINSAELVW